MFTVRQSLNCPHALAVNGGFLGLWFHKHFLTGVQTLHRKVKLSKTRVNFSVTLLKTLRNHRGPSLGVSRTEAEAFQVSRGTSSGLLFAHRARYRAPWTATKIRAAHGQQLCTAATPPSQAAQGESSDSCELFFAIMQMRN